MWGTGGIQSEKMVVLLNVSTMETNLVKFTRAVFNEDLSTIADMELYPEWVKLFNPYRVGDSPIRTVLKKHGAVFTNLNKSTVYVDYSVKPEARMKKALVAAVCRKSMVATEAIICAYNNEVKCWVSLKNVAVKNKLDHMEWYISMRKNHPTLMDSFENTSYDAERSDEALVALGAVYTQKQMHLRYDYPDKVYHGGIVYSNSTVMKYMWDMDKTPSKESIRYLVEHRDIKHIMLYNYDPKWSKYELLLSAAKSGNIALVKHALNIGAKGVRRALGIATKYKHEELAEYLRELYECSFAARA